MLYKKRKKIFALLWPKLFPRLIASNKFPDIQAPVDVEDEAKIIKVAFYRPSKLKLAFFYLFSVLTLGLLLLLSKWTLQRRIKLKYKKTSCQDATLLVIEGQGRDFKRFIVELYT